MQAYIVDDDGLVRRSLTRILQSHSIDATAFATPAEFLDVLDGLEFGCVMLDIRMPDRNGLDVLSEILTRHPPWPVIIASGSTDMNDAITAFRRGAIHFLRKPFHNDELIAVVREASVIGADRKAAYDRQELARRIKLSTRENEVLRAMAEGLQSKLIAFQMGLSTRTVEMHRSNIFAKLSARNASQAVAIARGLDLLAQPRAAA